MNKNRPMNNGKGWQLPERSEEKTILEYQNNQATRSLLQLYKDTLKKVQGGK